MEAIMEAVTTNILDIIIAVISIVVSYYIIPCIKNDFIPWLKERHMYDMIKKMVQAVEKLAETGVIEKCDKKQEVIKLLNEQGIEVDGKLDAFIESAVKELDLIVSTAKNEILNSEK